MSGIVAIARKISPIVLIAGGGMLVFAFFMPWWGITLEKPDSAKLERPKFNDPDFENKLKAYNEARKQAGEKQKDMKRVMDRGSRWYRKMYVDDYMKDALTDADDDAESITVRLWGWNTGTGITSLILGLLILPLGIVPIFVGAYRRWAWIGSFVAGVMGLILFILGMVFYFGSPGENAEGLAQGVGLSPGPFLVIFGSFGTLAAGVFSGVIGLLEFLRGGKSSAPPERRKKRRREPEYDEFDDDSAGFDDEDEPRRDDV